MQLHFVVFMEPILEKRENKLLAAMTEQMEELSSAANENVENAHNQNRHFPPQNAFLADEPISVYQNLSRVSPSRRNIYECVDQLHTLMLENAA